jgi:hypothetical protein
MAYLPALLIALLGLAAAPLIALRPGPSGPVAVVFAPSVGGREAFARVVRAGGDPVAAGPFDNVIIASGDVGFRRAVAEAGAWLLLEGGTSGCALPNSTNGQDRD